MFLECGYMWVCASLAGKIQFCPSVASTIVERFLKFSVQLLYYWGQCVGNFSWCALIGWVSIAINAFTTFLVFTKVSLCFLRLSLNSLSIRLAFQYIFDHFEKQWPSQPYFDFLVPEFCNVWQICRQPYGPDDSVELHFGL